MKLYGIRNKETGVPIGISIFSNEGGEFCNAAGAEFEILNPLAIYMVPCRMVAARALESDPHWYNASVERPQWPAKFNVSNWEVFEVNVPVIGE